MHEEQYMVETVSDIDKKKVKVQLEGMEPFALYKGEIRRFAIEEGIMLSASQFDEIQKILRKRAKERALYLLKDSSKTVVQVQNKLKVGLYPDDIIQEVIVFLEKYHYVDDREYVRNYYRTWKNRRSRREIQFALLGKGISKALFQEVLEEEDEEDEEEQQEVAIQYQIQKKLRGKTSITREEYTKVIRYLIGKGFAYSEVSDALKSSVEIFGEEC